jgi:hypothetical protein
VFSIRLQGKAFVERSIKFCLVDNQRSSGVTVAGSELCRFESNIANVESPPIDISIYLSEDRAIAYHKECEDRTEVAEHTTGKKISCVGDGCEWPR